MSNFTETRNDVKKRLATRIEEVCAKLLPNGKKEGREWVAGDVHGASGKSLHVCLTGEKAGLWIDHATGEGGDIFSLWATSKGISFKEAFEEAARLVGHTAMQSPAPKPRPAPFKKDGVHPLRGTEVMKHLNARGLLEPTLMAYQVRSHTRHSPHNTEFVCYQYHTPDKQPAFLKSTGIHRSEDGKKDIWTTPPYYTLWGWWLVKPTHTSCIITEGEEDAMSIHQMLGDGSIPVLSMPSGASNLTWIDNDFDYLNQFDRIYLCTDTDAAGEAASKKVAERLGLSRCYRIHLPGTFKDANELLRGGCEKDRNVKAWIEAATTYDPPTIINVKDILETALAWRKDVIEDKNTQSFVFPDVPFKWRKKELSMVTGMPGHGKSEFLYQAMLYEMQEGRKVGIASMEIPPEHMLFNLATQMTGRYPTENEYRLAMEWMEPRMKFFNPSKSMMGKWADLLKDFEYAATRFGLDGFVIDSFLFLVPKKDFEQHDKFSTECANFCKQNNVFMAVVAHSRKGEDESGVPGMYDVDGSQGITAAANNGLTVWRNKKKEEDMDMAQQNGDKARVESLAQQPDAILYCWKQRLTGKMFKRKLWFNPMSRRFRSHPTEDTGFVYDIDGNALLGGNDPF